MDTVDIGGRQTNRTAEQWSPAPTQSPTKCKCNLYLMRIQEVGDGEMSPGPGQETEAHTQRPPQPGGATVRAVPTWPAEHIYPIVFFVHALWHAGS